MKQLSLFVLLFILTLSSFGQVGKKEEINYSDPFQVDSSEYFIIPRRIDSENAGLYGKGKGYLSWSNYSELYFYNAATNSTKPLFNKLAIISPFYTLTYYHTKPPSTLENFLSNHIIYLARTENFNHDNGLDSDDPVYLYISTKKGEGLRQITPAGFHVLSFTAAKDGSFLLVKMMDDKTGNRKFGPGDNELYYRIDLHADIERINSYPIEL